MLTWTLKKFHTQKKFTARFHAPAVSLHFLFPQSKSEHFTSSNMADEVYEGAIGIDLGMSPLSTLMSDGAPSLPTATDIFLLDRHHILLRYVLQANVVATTYQQYLCRY
jgi:hypothetical protein